MSDFAKVKAAFPLVRFVERRNLGKLETSGASTFCEPAPCCGHKECFSITPDKEVWFCHSCDKGGDIFDLCMLVDGVEKGQALVTLAEEAGVAIEKPKEKKAPSGVEGVWVAAIDYYHSVLMGNLEMLAYQLGEKPHEQYGRHHLRNTLTHHKIGWADGKLRQHLQGRRFDQKTLEQSGLFVDGKEHFRGCFVYPSFDAAGRPLHFRAKFPKDKKTGKAPRAGHQLHADKRHKDWVCYNQGALGRHQEIVVCEGEDDLLTWWEAGVRHVIATCGGPSNDQINFFVENHPGKTWILAYDADDAGAGFINKFVERGLIVKVADPREVKEAIGAA